MLWSLPIGWAGGIVNHKYFVSSDLGELKDTATVSATEVFVHGVRTQVRIFDQQALVVYIGKHIHMKGALEKPQEVIQGEKPDGRVNSLRC
jgi:Zn-dependent M32 family carboxypeptidase